MQTRLFLFRNLPALELSKLSRKPIDKVFEVFEVNKDTGGELLPKNQEYKGSSEIHSLREKAKKAAPKRKSKLKRGKQKGYDFY